MNEIKNRVNVGFGIYTDKYRFVASNLEGFKLFSPDDSEQIHNIWEYEGLYHKNILKKLTAKKCEIVEFLYFESLVCITSVKTERENKNI